MGKLDGRVALVTGAARGQGRAEALALAREGADLIAVDVCTRPAYTDYPAATAEDLAETVRLVEEQDRRIVPAETDVRNLDELTGAVSRGVAELGGRLDVVVANAGIVTWGRFWEFPAEHWQTMIDINLTGVFHTLRAAAPLMIEAGNGGSIIATSSLAGIKSLPGQAHYSAAKHGVVGLVKTAAMELAPYRIRVNSIHPWTVETEMGKMGPDGVKVYAENPAYRNALGQIYVDPPKSTPEDIATTVLFLASDDSRTITAAQFTIDHGASRI